MNDINVVTILSARAFVLEINMFYGASGRDKQCLGYPDCFFMEFLAQINVQGHCLILEWWFSCTDIM